MAINRRLLLKTGAALLTGVCLGRTEVVSALNRFWLYDSHCHLISADEERYPRTAVNLAVDPSKPMPRLPGTHFGQINVDPTLADVLKWMGENEVDGGVAVQKKSTYGYDNRFTLEASDLVSEKFIAVVVVDATNAGSGQEIQRYAREHHLAGIRLSGMQGNKASYDWLTGDNALKTWAVANELELSVDLMAVLPGYDANTIENYHQLAQRFPKTRVVLNHLAWPSLGDKKYGINDGLKRLADLANVYFKFTTINLNMLDEAEVSSGDFLRTAVSSLGADRLMWGSDIGNSPGTYSEMVAKILAASSGLSDAARHNLLSTTARSVYLRR